MGYTAALQLAQTTVAVDGRLFIIRCQVNITDRFGFLSAPHNGLRAVIANGRVTVQGECFLYATKHAYPMFHIPIFQLRNRHLLNIQRLLLAHRLKLKNVRTVALEPMVLH